jgi:hypothetical protein
VADVLVQFSEPVSDAQGRAYTARAVGRPGDSGLWEGWLEFIPLGAGGHALRTARETTQPNRADLGYWATGLSMGYLEGALRRAKAPTHVVSIPKVDATPWFSEPAPEVVVREVVVEAPRPVLDPFAVYLQGEHVLRQELSALSADHLRHILRAYMPGSTDVDELIEPELRERIVALARGWAMGIRGSGPEPGARPGS